MYLCEVFRVSPSMLLALLDVTLLRDELLHIFAPASKPNEYN